MPALLRTAGTTRTPELPPGGEAMRPRLARSLLWAAAVCLQAAPAPAHDPGLSAADLRLEAGRISATLTFSPADFLPLAPASGLRELAREALEVRIDGRPLRPLAVDLRVEGQKAIQIHLDYPRPAGRRFSVRSALLGRLARGHRQLLELRGEDGRKLAARLLDSSSDLFEVDLAGDQGSARPAPTFLQFLGLGVEHILTGYDHLVFLLGLLLAGGSFLSVARVITSFSVAHSITLVLSTLDLVRLPPSWVEPLIAASIVYVGVENLVRRDPQGRWLLTFGFGLAHGFGFATALRELGIGAGGAGAALPLLSFNLGVEIGQMAVALLILPWIWKLRRRPSFTIRFSPALSGLVALAGGFWLVERIFF
jgi:hydrogenase/urease accessory protein HupE